MRLEDLVPPLELCKQLKPGEFEDSAMVWMTDGTCEPRRCSAYIAAPAPTLAEIMNEFRKNTKARWPVCEQHPNGTWFCKVFDWDQGEGSIADHNAATAAMRLYLEVRHD